MGLADLKTVLPDVRRDDCSGQSVFQVNDRVTGQACQMVMSMGTRIEPGSGPGLIDLVNHTEPDEHVEYSIHGRSGQAG
jgi:hypothetical protein